MCGIAGWFCWGDYRPDLEMIQHLLIANSTRGTDASGLAYLGEYEGKPDVVLYRKDQMPAKEFVKAISEENWKAIAASPRGLLHARARTKGSEKDNKNNHPVMGWGWVVVHNGTITNDDDLFTYYKDEERPAEVDSIALPLLLGKGKSLEESLKHLTLISGSATLAAWKVEEPDKIILARFGHNDLYMFLDPKNKIMYWSSAAIAGHFMPAHAIGHVRFLTVSKLADDRAIVLNKDFDQNQTFRLKRNPYILPYHLLRGGVKSNSVQSSTQMTTTQRGPTGAVVSKVDWSQENSDRKTGKFIVYHTVETKWGQDKYKISWQQEDSKLLHDKPMPECNFFTHEYAYFNELEREVRESTIKGKKRFTMLTPYGRWVFYNAGGKLDRHFKPRKAMVKWWRRRFDMKHVYLPWPLESDCPLNWKLPRETYLIQRQTTQGSTIQLLGSMCPWCGTVASNVEWNKYSNRCCFCLVQSKLEERI